MNFELICISLLLIEGLSLGQVLVRASQKFDERYDQALTPYERNYPWQKKTFLGLKK